MRNAFVAVAMAAILLSAATAKAQLVYSFEAPPVNPDGFGPNGGGVTVTQDTIGATDGLSSMKISVVGGATFVGALTGAVNPLIGNPPGVTALTFDMTIASGDDFTGAFADIGITIFGASQPGPGQMFGLQAQFADIESIGGKGPGTYPVRIDLTSATNQVDFSTGQTFNQIFGSGPTQQIPTGVEFFISKSGDAPSTVYIDNVHVVGVPEPASMGLLSMGAVVFGFVSRRRRS
ncbi:MAG TPA: PEP-CTERM sorting domain-containing protein [Lacipirellulaceae bacterium]|nr:PEP-CTERM sorting domain-containing protein [Lacipirellulaceae bacterium]